MEKDFLNPKNWKFETKTLKLRNTWKISRNSSTEKQNLFISLKAEKKTIYAEAAPNIRFNETIERYEREMQEFSQLLKSTPDIQSAYKAILASQYSNSLIFALTSIYHQYQALRQNVSLEDYLGITSKEFIGTTFSIPMMEANEIPSYINEQGLQDYSALKLKIKNHQDLPQIQILSDHFAGKILIDANEGLTCLEDWDLLIKGLDCIKKIELIEQPFPGDMTDLYAQVKKISPYPIFLDESILDQNIDKTIQQQCHGINIKLMKSRDLLKAIQQLSQAKSLGLKTMVGCMIESSLGISLAMRVAALTDYADLDGHLLISNDPFDLIHNTNGALTLK